MDPIDINFTEVKQKKWNPFQKVKNRSVPNLAQLATNLESREFERVSYATSIKKLPQRPSAFTQVLKQIGASRASKPEKMKRVHSFKRNNKDGRSNSPQPQYRLSVGSAVTPSSLEVATRPRTLSSSSDRLTSLPSDFKFQMNVTGLEDLTMNNVERSVSVDQVRANSPTNVPIPAGALLANENLGQPMVAGTSMASNNTAVENGSTSFDVVDGASVVDVQKLRQDTEHLQQKILKISEAVKVEQATRDDNVTEYLKLATNADRQQAGRIKSVFEKKNQKSNATIQQLQKKLDTYHRRLRDLENGGGGKPWKVRGNLKDFSGGVVESVKGGLSGLQQVTQNAAGAIAAKPKDLASKIKSRFGSADNLHTLSNDETHSDDFAMSNRYGSADDVSSASGSTTDNLVQDSERRSVRTSPSKNNNALIRDGHSQQLQEVANQLIFVKTELQEIRQSQSKFEAMWVQWKEQSLTEMNFLTNSLQDEKFRNERLEVQLNDLTELHQREMCNLKQELTSMEEKVEYHAHERARDMQEALESCQTRISKMELQQQQQLMPGDGLQTANARVLTGKLINLLMSVLAVVLVLVSAVYNISMPLFKTQGRVITTVCAFLAFIIAYKNWTYFLSFWGSD